MLRKSSSGTRQNFPDRVAAGNLAISLIGEMDLAFAPESINDNLVVNAAYTDAAVGAAWTSNIRAVMAARPKAFIISTGPQNPDGLTPQSLSDGNIASIYALARAFYLSLNADF